MQKSQALVDLLEELAIENSEELTYLITMVTHRYLNQNPENYISYNNVIGALEGCKLELHRRHISLYENDKCVENGDV